MTRPTNRNGVSLLELLIAVALISVIILAVTSIDMFGRRQALDSDRRAKLQNEITFILEDMTKKISKAAGNELAQGKDSVIQHIYRSSAIPGGSCFPTLFLNFHADTNNDAIADIWQGYNFNCATHILRFCANCSGDSSNWCSSCSSSWETLSSDRINFIAVAKNSAEADYNWRYCGLGVNPPCSIILDRNSLLVWIYSRYGQHTISENLYSPNPFLTMETNIPLPLVSTN